MRKRVVFAVLFFAIIVLSILWWLGGHSQRLNTPETLAVVTSQPNPSAAQIQQNQAGNTPQVAAVSSLNPTTNPAAWIDTRIKQMEEAHQNSLNDWRTPIEFYGKVVDENTNPIAGAEIDFGCNDLSATGTSNYHSTSDGNGLFSIIGIAGKLLSVNVSKEGYYNSKRDNNYFTYAGENVNFVPDAQNPIFFHLRKKAQGESLIITDYPGLAHIAQLHHDGTPVELDLLRGVETSPTDGQLKLELWRDLSDKNAKIFDWKLQLSAPSGGLIETDEEFDFEAPQSGYQPSIVIDMPATNANWQGEVRSKYYIRLANGNYGRIDFYLLSRNGVFTVQSAINPDGSQNLEPQ
jgi:hypothetical protein